MVQQNGPDLRKIETNLEKIAAAIKNVADGLRESNKAIKSLNDIRRSDLQLSGDLHLPHTGSGEIAILPLKDQYGRRIGYAEVEGSKILCHISDQAGEVIMQAIKVGMTSGLSISPQLDSAVPATFNTNKEKTNAEGE